jgi:kynurenine 3-monooxygenase
MVHAPDGTTELQPYGNTDAEVIHSVSRSGLNAILLDAVEATGSVSLHFGQRCRADDFEAGTLRFTDDSEGIEYEIGFETVFGTDGAGSVVRDAVVAAAGGRVDVARLGHGYKELTLAPGSNGEFRIEPEALHVWPRRAFMLIALANPGHDFTVTLFMPDDGGADSFATLDSADAVERFFAREFPDFAALVPDIAHQFLHNPTGDLATVRCSGWSHGSKGVLVGDAAHAIVPFHGQGMNAAFESCLVLDRHMRAARGDLAAGFAAFEAERRRDTDAIADMALDNYVEMRAGTIDSRHRLQRELALELERRFPGVFISRYAMVMFHTMPYAEARRRAIGQAGVLDALTDGISSVADVDFDEAGRRVAALQETS